jgi:hypothetical protein
MKVLELFYYMDKSILFLQYVHKVVAIYNIFILDYCYCGSAKISKEHEEDTVRWGIADLDKESRSLSNGEEDVFYLPAKIYKKHMV